MDLNPPKGDTIWKKRLAVLSLLVLAVGAISAVAFAQEDGEGAGKGEQYLSGTGSLWARGTGSADLDVAEGKIQFRLNGDITITGPADLDVRINGAETPLTEDGATVVVLTDFDGTIGVRGAGFTIDADGEIALRGRGTGSVTLTGDGHWKTLHDQGSWTEVELALAPDVFCRVVQNRVLPRNALRFTSRDGLAFST